MNYQDVMIKSLTKKQKQMRELADEIAADFGEYSEYCKSQGLPVNVEAFGRLMQETKGYAPRLVRRYLINKNVIKPKKRNGKSNEDTNEGITFWTLPSCDGSTTDGHSPVHTV